VSRRQLTKIEEMFLNSPTCLLWPRCGCHETITHWQRLLDDPNQRFTLEELEAAEVVIYINIACAAAHCPDPETKAYAAQQYANLTRRRQRIGLANVKAG